MAVLVLIVDIYIRNPMLITVVFIKQVIFNSIIAAVRQLFSIDRIFLQTKFIDRLPILYILAEKFVPVHISGLFGSLYKVLRLIQYLRAVFHCIGILRQL